MIGKAAVGESSACSDAFEEEVKEPLVDIKLTDSTELWLIQWPSDVPADFDGREVNLNLDRDGKLGSFEGTSGKEYDVVSYGVQKPDATVFTVSPSGSEVVGKISRRVSFVHYPDPAEVEKLKPRNLKQFYLGQRGSMITSTSLLYSTPTQSTKLAGSRSSSKHMTSSGGSRRRGASILSGELSRPRKQAGESSVVTTRRSHDSAHAGSTASPGQSQGHNTAIPSGSQGDSCLTSLKKKRKKSEE